MDRGQGGEGHIPDQESYKMGLAKHRIAVIRHNANGQGKRQMHCDRDSPKTERCGDILTCSGGL